MRQLVGRDVAGDLAPERRFAAAAAADHQVIALDLLVAAGIDLGREQADIADVMLGAGIRAAGQMNVDRLVEGDAFIQMIADGQRVALRVGEREFAAGIAGAGDETAANIADLRGEPERLDLGDRVRDLGIRHIGQDQILPDRQAQRAGAMPLGNAGDAMQLRRAEP